MFLPDNIAAKNKGEEERKAAFKKIEQWSLEIIPQEIRADAQVSIQEVQCGDPNCAPIDTAITIVFKSGGDGIMGLPMEAKDVTEEDLAASFPTKEVLEKWHRGEDADWPPMEDIPSQMPQLRFDVGARVQCRVGPDAERDWAAGEIIMLWYRESSWPPGSFAPYKIKLDDGRDIFAPGDMDQVIRRAP